MHELKEKINEALANYKKAWINEFALAKQENRKFKLQNVMLEDVEITKAVNNYFLEADDRMKKSKKGFF